MLACFRVFKGNEVEVWCSEHARTRYRSDFLYYDVSLMQLSNRLHVVLKFFHVAMRFLQPATTQTWHRYRYANEIAKDRASL